jgi:tripartite-type tricarboxylate transporter receptor subunit TctC
MGIENQAFTISKSASILKSWFKCCCRASLLALGMLQLTHSQNLNDGPVQLTYPSRAVTIINPYPPGGGADNVARMVASALGQEWGQPVLVESKPGGATTIAAAFVAKSKPDGYTLLLSSTQHAIAPAMMKSLSYDYLNGLQAVATLSFSPFFLVVSPKLPVDDLPQFINLLKKNGNRMNFASSGNASLPHLSGELLNQNLKIKIQHIPYQGTSPATNALLAGDVDFLFADNSAIPLIQSGKLKAFATTSEKRSDGFSQLPTVSEVIPNFTATVWTALEVPSGTPKYIVEKIHSTVKKALTMPPIMKFYKDSSREALVLTPAEFANFKKAEVEKYEQIVKNAHLELALD